MNYEVISATVQEHEVYPDEYRGAAVVELRRDDGVVGDVWVTVAKSQGVQDGYQKVSLYGDPGDGASSWCPDTFDANDCDKILDSCTDVALAAWHKFREGEGRYWICLAPTPR